MNHESVYVSGGGEGVMRFLAPPLGRARNVTVHVLRLGVQLFIYVGV